MFPGLFSLEKANSDHEILLENLALQSGLRPAGMNFSGFQW
jgi:hypothetical protein